MRGASLMRYDADAAAALQREEEKATQVIKHAAKNGETRGCRNIAAAIARSRKMSRRLQTVKFRLDSVEINLQQQRCMPCWVQACSLGLRFLFINYIWITHGVQKHWGAIAQYLIIESANQDSVCGWRMCQCIVAQPKFSCCTMPHASVRPLFYGALLCHRIIHVHSS